MPLDFNSLVEKQEPSKEIDFNSLVEDPLKKKSTPSVSSATPSKLPSQDKFKQGLEFAQQGFKMPSAAVQQQQKEQGWLMNTVSALDKGFYKNLVGSPVKGLGTLLQGTTAKVMGGTGEGFVSDALIKFGDYFNKTIDELTPQDEEYKNTLSNKVAEALGQVGSMVLTGGIAGMGQKGASLASQLPKAAAVPTGTAALNAAKGLGKDLINPVSVSAGLAMGQSEFDRAKEFGATDDEAFEAFYKNAAVGSVLEQIPVMQFLKRFNTSTAGGVANYIKTKGMAGISGGLEELTTEVLQQLYANKTAKDIYNINQDIFEGVAESGGIGFGVGFLLNALGASAKIMKKEGRKEDAKVVEDQMKSFESKMEADSKFQENEDITQFPYTLKAKKPSVIMPEENVAPQVIPPTIPATAPAVIMPEENIPAETTTISPDQKLAAPAVIMPEANVAPDFVDLVQTEEEVKPTEVSPEIKTKLEAFKEKFAPQPKEVSISGVQAAEKRVNRQKALDVTPVDARGFALQWMNSSPDVLDWDSIKDLFGGRRAALNVKEITPEEIAKRDYVAKKDTEGKPIDKIANDIWNNLPEGLENDITTMDIKDELEKVISEYTTRADAAKALIEMAEGQKGKNIEQQQLEFAQQKGEQDQAEGEVPSFEGGFVPFKEEVDIKDFSKDLEKKYNLTLDISEQGDDITLSRIIVPEKNRKQGIGTKAMQELVDYADANNKRILLTPSTDFGATSTERLKDFYKEFGFVENKGKNKDFKTKEGMYRNPKLEEAPFAVQEGVSPEVQEMQDIVKDYIDNGVTSLSDIKKAIAKELGYNTKALRRTIDDAYNRYTTTKEAAPVEVVSGIVGRIGNALKSMFGKDAQKPFIAKDSKALEVKLNDIREDVKFQIEAGFRGTNGMPVAYRYDTDQVARERFDIPNLKQIGSGSDRVVFDLGDGKVLKVAKTPRGLEQNIQEGDYYLSGNIIPEVFERGLNYVVVEKIEPPLKATKGYDKLNDLLNKIQKFTQKDFDQHNSELQDVMYEYDLGDIFNYDILWNDFKAKRNWGIKDGQPLHLDGGTFGGIQMLDKFKGQKPLSDPEFRDIYNRSKKAKIENKDIDKFTKFMANPDADILGFTYQNKMYLNAEKLNPNTPIHEAGHIWVEWTKANDPKIYAKGMELVEGSPYLTKAKESKFYQQQTENMNDAEKEEYFKNEALAMAIGDKGAQFVVESKKESFKNWLNSLWSKIKNLTGFSDLTAEEFQNLTFEEFTKMAVKEILGVENALDKLNSMKSFRSKKNFVKSNLKYESNKKAIDELDFTEEDLVKIVKANFDLSIFKNIKNAVQERSTKKVLQRPQGGVGERRGERKRVEPRVEGEEIARESEKEAQPEGVAQIPDEIENVGLDNGDVDYVGITEADINALRKSLGLPKYQGLPMETHDMLRDIAQKMIKEGVTVQSLYDKIRRGDNLTNYENAFMAEYRAALDLELSKNPSKELLDQVKEFTDTFQVGASLTGKALESLKIMKKLNEANTLSNFLLGRQEDKGFPLTAKMIVEETNKFEKLQKAKEELQESSNNDVLNTIKNEVKKEPKKSSEEYAKERKQALADAREALRKLRSGEEGLMVSLPGLNELVAVAPHMNKYVKSLLSEGVSKLDDIVTEVHKEFSELIDGLTKRDVLDVISGKYTTKTRTVNEINAGLRLLRREANLMLELEKARKNEEEAKSESQMAKSSARIQQLENKIKEVRELNRAKQVSEEGFAERNEGKTDKEYNERRQKFLYKKIKGLEDDLKNKNYDKQPTPAPKYKISDRTKKMMDRVVELEKQIALEKLKDQQAKLSKWEKAWDKIQSVLGLRRIIQTSIDASIWFRQLAKLTMNPRKWDIALKFISSGAQSIFSQKNYDRIMYQIHQAPDFKESEADGVKYNELGTPNEMFPKSFLFEIPLLREPFMASQRIADGSINVARYELYNKYKRELLKQGITRESDPEMYKAVGKVVMNSTGSGNMLKFLESKEGQKVMGGLFYGAKLMASNFNTLNPAYYVKLPKEVRNAVMKDLASYTATVMSVVLALVAAGGKVSLDPEDPDFLQVRFGEKVYDFTAGQAAYIRTFLRWVNAGYNVATKSKFEAKEKASFAWNSTLNFFRNKLAPNNAYVVNALVGKNAIGEDFDPMEIFHIYPMYADDAYQAAKEDGFISLLTVLMPNILGVGYSSYYADKAMKPMDEIINRAQDSDEMNPETIRKDITKNEFKEFAKLRDKLIEEKIKDLYKEGIFDEETGEQIPINKSTTEQISKAISKIKREATNEAKSEFNADEED